MEPLPPLCGPQDSDAAPALLTFGVSLNPQNGKPMPASTQSTLAAALAVGLALAGPVPAMAQDAGGAWLKCEVTSRTTHTRSNSSSFSFDHTAGYLQVDGSEVLRLTLRPDGTWQEDARCDDEDFQRRRWDDFTCRTTSDSVVFMHHFATYPGDARAAARAGDEPRLSGQYGLTINRRDGSFRYDRTEYEGNREAGETARGTCRRVDDPRPPALF
jgi:hypothetical protein